MARPCWKVLINWLCVLRKIMCLTQKTSFFPFKIPKNIILLKVSVPGTNRNGAYGLIDSKAKGVWNGARCHGRGRQGGTTGFKIQGSYFDMEKKIRKKFISEKLKILLNLYSVEGIFFKVSTMGKGTIFSRLFFIKLLEVPLIML